ncbi:hypothetical protein [Pseudomonas sessilinigenes]|uniref:PLL-like beta propeller domain-containing protein n=1 Tax=Pseudomonas sessilinigenes TaxID=658629 RepID=A0ABX8MLS4_9PSED|nr:hypothetical protein [Pseudomonas sessilinigenes]AZC26581.1 hypothetical protein C4K39_4936 [Pseudomonas sessilinigenes]QXH39420.1 hypothetical protein KSS89_24830 [Pseudomonas sessilinigenes]
MTTDVPSLIRLLQPLREQGMTAVQAANTVLAQFNTGSAGARLADAFGPQVSLVQALVQVYAPVTLPEMASILHQLYPDLGPVAVGKILLAPGVFPHTTAEQMQSALVSAGFSPAAVTQAIKELYPAPPVQEPFAAIATSMQGGNRGIELWVAGTPGQVWTLYQRTPGANWSAWEGPGFKNQPKPLMQLAAALQNNGNVLFAGLDGAGSVWTCGQGSPGGDWNAWSGPNVGAQPCAFEQLAASQQGGHRGVELWAAGADGQVWTLYQLTAGGAWSHWEGPGFKGQPTPLFKLAAAQQNNGNVMFWGLDREGRLWGIGQQSPGGDWGAWQGPGFVGQPEPFTAIAASEQLGNRGVELWGIGASGQLWTLYQTTAGGPWSRWEGPGFKQQPAPMKKVAAALQNTGCVLLWAVDNDNQLWQIAQGSPGGDWAGWTRTSPPPQG